MTEFTFGQTLWLHFVKTKLHRGIAIFFQRANLNDIARPGFNDSHRDNVALVGEHLRHADLSTNNTLHTIQEARTASSLTPPHHPQLPILL